MEMFFVYRKPSQDNRVVLDDFLPDEDAEMIISLAAKNRAEARNQLRPSGIELYHHRPGHGFFEVL